MRRELKTKTLENLFKMLYKLKLPVLTSNQPNYYKGDLPLQLDRFASLHDFSL